MAASFLDKYFPSEIDNKKDRQVNLARRGKEHAKNWRRRESKYFLSREFHLL